MNDVMFFANLIKKVDLNEEALKIFSDSTVKCFQRFNKSLYLLGVDIAVLAGIAAIHAKSLKNAQDKIEALDKRIAALEYSTCEKKIKQHAEHNTEFDDII